MHYWTCPFCKYDNKSHKVRDHKCKNCGDLIRRGRMLDESFGG